MKQFPKDKAQQKEIAQKAIDSGRIECPGIMLYRSFFDAAQFLTPEEVGQLVVALGTRRFEGEEPAMPSNRAVAIAYADARVKADLDLLKYATKVVKNRYNATGKRVMGLDGKEHLVRDDFETWFEKYYGVASSSGAIDESCSDFDDYDDLGEESYDDYN